MLNKFHEVLSSSLNHEFATSQRDISQPKYPSPCFREQTKEDIIQCQCATRVFICCIYDNLNVMP